MTKVMLLALLIFMPSVPFALDCVVEVKKASCWANYNVSITVKTVKQAKQITIFLPQKTKTKAAVFRNTATIACQPGDKLIYSAQFNPPIWDNEKKSPVIAPKESIAIPIELPANTDKVAVAICYPKDFKHAPYPYEYTPDCHCQP